MFTGNPSTQHGPISQRYFGQLSCRPSKQARMQLGKGVEGIFWESSNGWCSNKSPKKLLTYPWFNIEAWNKGLFSFSGKRGLKKFCVENRFSCDIGAGGILQTLFIWFRFLKSVQYFELTEYVDRCSKGVKGWKHQEPFLKLIWRDSGQVDWKLIFFEGGSTVQMLFELGVHQWPSIPVVSWREKEPPY